MDRKFQIFVSSTYEDLIEERRAVIEAILDLGHIPVGMEAFQASNEEQWGYIQKRIDEADYYVVIVAERYGSINANGVSYTEMEYDYARKKGVPVAAFLLHDEIRAAWRREKADTIDNRTRIDEFRKKCQGFMVQRWRNKHELAAACVKSLSHMFAAFPRDGWVPAKIAMKPEVANELARLSKENGELKHRCMELEQQRHNSKAKMESLLENLSILLMFDIVNDVIKRLNYTESMNLSLVEFGEDKRLSMKELFMMAGTHALSGCSYYSIYDGLSNHIPKIELPYDPNDRFDFLGLVVTDIIDYFLVMDLLTATIDTVTRPFAEPKTKKHFHLTSLGKECLFMLRSESPESLPIVIYKYR